MFSLPKLTFKQSQQQSDSMFSETYSEFKREKVVWDVEKLDDYKALTSDVLNQFA